MNVYQDWLYIRNNERIINLLRGMATNAIICDHKYNPQPVLNHINDDKQHYYRHLNEKGKKMFDETLSTFDNFTPFFCHLFFNHLVEWCLI